MRLILFLSLVTFISCEFDPKTFDWSVVKPLRHTKAFRDAFPEISKLISAGKIFENRHGRIIRGEVASPYDFPFHVGLLLSYPTEQSWCSGSLITRKSVLTSATCGLGSPTITALFGASDILATKEYIFVDKITIHEGFRDTLLNYENDIAILTLTREAELTSQVSIVRLPVSTSDNFVDRSTAVAGW